MARMKKLAPLLLFAALVVALAATCTPLLLAGCQPVVGPVVPSPDGGAPAETPAVCDNLTALGCKEGGSHCPDGVKKLSALTRPPLACWAGAKSKAEARACGQLECP